MEVRTSESHPIRIDWLRIDGPGRLGMTFAPGKKKSRAVYGNYAWDRDLGTDLEALVQAGATVLVTLLEAFELQVAKIPDLFERARAAGLEVVHFPIRDVSTPTDVDAVHDLLDQIEDRLSAGESVVVHCMGGLGRTGTIAGCFLRRTGMDGPEALAELRRARRTENCPETWEQRDYVTNFRPRVMDSLPYPDGEWYAINPERLRDQDEIVRWVTSGATPREVVRSRVERAERAVRSDPAACFSFDDRGFATLLLDDGSFSAGHFSTPSLEQLRARLNAREDVAVGSVRLSILHGAHPLSDIGTLQATAPEGTLFQAASQFNCLEAPSERIVPVHAYTGDFTQGPRASVSAFPATLLRHYRAPGSDGTRYVQTDDHCINLLGDAFGPEIAEVYSGYLEAQHVHDPEALADALEQRFEKLRVGVHDGVEVVYGHDWGGRVPSGKNQRIAQVFTSTIALGYSVGGSSPAFERVRRQLLRAAYLGTLLAAIDLGKHTVVLTLIGGGVFRNPHRDIWDAIHWAMAEVDPVVGQSLHVVVNTRDALAEEDRGKAEERGGHVIEFARRDPG
jgi:protein-tyrosine phosphatase